MASNSTPFAGLNQWLADDPVLREDFNADNQKLDNVISLLGNCCIASGSYVGDGQFGEGTSCHLELGFKPLVIFMDTGSGESFNEHIVWFNNGLPPTHIDTPYVHYFISWEDTGMSWYMTCATTTHNNAASQLNVKDKTYHYLALGYKV